MRMATAAMSELTSDPAGALVSQRAPNIATTATPPISGSAAGSSGSIPTRIAANPSAAIIVKSGSCGGSHV